MSEKNAIKSQLEEAKKRFEVGLIAITDLADAQASYDLSVTRVIEAESLSDLEKESLYILTGKLFKPSTLSSMPSSLRQYPYTLAEPFRCF